MKPRPQTPETEQSAAPAARNPAQNRRRAGLLLGCAALMALLAAVPLGWFALSDAALLDRPAAMTQPYESVTPSGDDFYLIRQLRTQAELVNVDYTGSTKVTGETIYTPSGDEMMAMRQDYTMAQYADGLLVSLEEAGVLPSDWVYTARNQLSVDGYTIWYSMDSLGFLRLCRFEPGSGVLTLQIIVESRTGKPVNLFIASDLPLSEPDAAAVLPAWIQFNELDGLGDWEAPANTDFAENGLYSARGGVLASADAVGPADWGEQTLYGLCMNLGLWEPNPVEPAELPQGWQVGNLRKAQSGPFVFQPTGYSGGFGVLCGLTPDGMQVACGYPGCGHDSPACPAWVAAYGLYHTATINNQIYLLYSGQSRSNREYMADEFLQGEEYATLLSEVQRLGTENDVLGLEESVRLATQPARIETLDENWMVRSWCNERDSDDMVYWDWEDGEALYSTESDYEITGYVPSVTLYRTPLDGGETMSLPLPEGNELELLGGSYALLSRHITAVDLEALARNGSNRLSYYVSVADQIGYTLYDLNTGESRTLMTVPNTATETIYPVYMTDDALYYTQYLEWNESYQAYMGMSITRLDLKTGERRSLLDEEIGAELSWGYRCVMLEDGDRSYLCMSVENGINTGSYRMLVLDLTSEETWIADDWIAGPNSSSVMASLVDLRDGLLYAILGYEDRSSMYANYGYTVPVYGTIPWQDYLAGSEDWTYIEPWDGSPNPIDPEGIAAWQSALGLG